MKIYVAGLYSKLAELAEESKKLIDAGFEVTATWLQNAEDGLTFEHVAHIDLNDVDAAAVLILYTEPYGTPVPGGGRHVEFGYALGKGKQIIIVGPRENIFHWHRDVMHFPRIEYAIRYLTEERTNEI